ncbi:hypothetical protein [Chlamydia psittaci]|uniref:Lipoprotein n=1 Tax=Chlamydia psittaci 99DC5 TaxID=1112251 RepID=A0ABP2X4D4_CHLPS|nr:hypothetical protein [Chlamydia psittaci]AFS19151.1 putative lipoprotein [Chlamydia psittaci 84/55]AFS22350.1 putative lipoprotein [Chlamydia psittaci VS225]AGE74731.1 putative lipoprotein [Chlamydia psittaci Mat116]EPJ15981.1 putative lipoprotein [Chlamydia psittaci 02DC18]EPJ17026.1 putative lipoprotein [Chlamydia psittaci 02DC22]EPJ18262.1 putative lipoprotein [Chlamydia psittaci 01DC11]EPJ19838.1 putative lipoprotein [Chlamydia psittaci 02DC23]EPJ20939.1 putative lipoprotein [Chlamyd
MRFLSIFLFVFSFITSFSLPVYSEHYISEDEKFHIDRFNFSGEFPDMETMEIHAQRKKRVHFDVSGDFPKLESIVYNGSFGFLRAKLTGRYPELTSLVISCSSCKMDLDFRGKWERNATISLSNEAEPLTLTLPKNVGVIVHTKVSTKGKVMLEGDFEKRGRGIWRKTYHNSLVGIAPVTLVFEVQSGSGGTITLR